MTLDRDQVAEQACSILALAYRSIGDYAEANDGFCRRCPAQKSDGWNFRNGGQSLEYVRKAVVEKLIRDGYQITEGFDPITGLEVEP